MMEWIVNMLIALILGMFGIGVETDAPEWCGTEWHFGTEECGSCGAELHVWRTTRDYADHADVPACIECYELFADDTPEHREQMYEDFWSDSERVAYWTSIWEKEE